MLGAIMASEWVDGSPLQRILGVVSGGDPYLLAIWIHLKGEGVVHSVYRGPEKVTVVPDHSV